MGTVYEVDLDLDAAIAEDYLAWLREHVAEILALPGFVDAQIQAVRDPAPEAGRVRLCVSYRLDGPASLEAYLRDHAPRLRAQGMERFGGRFSASRRVMDVLPR